MELFCEDLRGLVKKHYEDQQKIRDKVVGNLKAGS